MKNKIERGHFNSLNSFMAKCLGILPKPIIRVIYNCFRNCPGYIGLGIRYSCIKNLAAKCGRNVAIFQNCVIKHPENLRIGDNVSVHQYCYIDAIGGVEMGDNVSIANHSSMISFGHTYDDIQSPIKYNPLTLTPIEIKDDVWIGCGVRVIGPCRISERVIVAAGAVAKGDLYSGSIYGGVPVRKLKSILCPSSSNEHGSVSMDPDNLTMNQNPSLGGGKRLIIKYIATNQISIAA